MLKDWKMDQNSGKRMRNIRIAFAILVLTAFAVYQKVYVLNDEAKLREQQLEVEFNLIAPFPNSTVTHSLRSYKDRQALVDNSFSAFANYEEVRKHYDVELAKRGWFFVSEQRVTNWGRDLGGKGARYCKGDWSAYLQYFGGSDKDGERHYSFGLSTGIDPC
jgi:hypothetical protein